MSNKNNDDLKRQASENTLGLNPVIGLRRKDLLTSARMVLTQAIKQPLHSAKHVAHFGVELKNVMFGKSTLQPEGDDRRFNDPAWSQNPLYKRYLQTYLAWRKELHDWIGHSNLSEQDISRAHFVINLMTEAMAPTNTAANPAAVKRFFETGGKACSMASPIWPRTWCTTAACRAKSTWTPSRSARTWAPVKARWCFATTCWN